MRATRALSGIAIALSALLLGALSAAAQPASPQSWPQRPVKFILPLGPGSGADIGARLIAEKLAAKWGQPVVVENRPGGDGFVAINAFTSARDDHILLFGPASAFTAHPYPAREAALRSARPRAGGPRQRDAGDDHRAAVARRQVARRSRRHGARATRQAQLGDRHRRHRSGGRRLSQGAEPRHGENPLSRSGAGAERRGRRPPAFLLGGARHRAGADAGRPRQGDRDHGERAVRRRAGHPDGDPGGLPGPHLRRSGRPLRHARHAGRACARSIAADVKDVLADPAIVSRLQATGQEVVPGSAAEFAAAIDRQRAASRKPPRCWASRPPRSRAPAETARRTAGFPFRGRPAYKADMSAALRRFRLRHQGPEPGAI